MISNFTLTNPYTKWLNSKYFPPYLKGTHCHLCLRFSWVDMVRNLRSSIITIHSRIWFNPCMQTFCIEIEKKSSKFPESFFTNWLILPLCHSSVFTIERISFFLYFIRKSLKKTGFRSSMVSNYDIVKQDRIRKERERIDKDGIINRHTRNFT